MHDSDGGSIFRRVQYGRRQTSGVIEFRVFWQVDSSKALWGTTQQEGNKR